MSTSADDILSVAEGMTAHGPALRSARVNRNETVTFCISGDIKAAFQKAAQSRGMALSRLGSELLTAIVRDNLFNAVLDDEAKQ